MISKRVVLVGTAVVGVSYVLAIDSLSKPSRQLVPTDEREREAASVAAPTLASVQLASSEPSTRRELAELTTELAQLKSELSSLRERTPNKPAPTFAEPPLESDEQVQAQHDQYMAEIERAFEREPRDASWAGNISQLLRQALAAEPPMLAAVRGIECRSSSCRMELYDDGSPAFTESFPALLHHMGAILPEVRFDHSELAGGAQLHTLYMTQSATD